MWSKTRDNKRHLTREYLQFCITLWSVHWSWWAMIGSMCWSPCVFNVCQTNSKLTGTVAQLFSPRLFVSLQTHTGSSLSPEKPRMAFFSHSRAFKYQEKDGRQCLKKDLAHCRGKNPQLESEAGPIKNTCPTTNPSTDPAGRRLWRQRLHFHPCA